FLTFAVSFFSNPRHSLKRLYSLTWEISSSIAKPVVKWLVRKLRGLGAHEPVTMSWYAYAFNEFKRKRNSKFPNDLSQIRCPTQKGLVSVILPVYNGARVVAESVESVLRQSYKNFELIIIDDGSTDDTPAILDKYASRDSRIKVIHQENRQLPQSLSNGFRLARGEFLTWTSDDNRMKQDFLKKMVDDLESKPSVDMIYANIDIIGEDGEYIRNSDWYRLYQNPPGSEHISLPKDPSELNIWTNNYVGSAFLYRDRVAYLLGDYSKLRFTSEDYDYWIRINEMLTLRHAGFEEPVYEYRFHSSSLTSREKELKIMENRMSLMAFDDFRRDFTLYPITWIFDSHFSDKPGEQIFQRLRKKAERARHIVMEPGELIFEKLPRLWYPSVYICVTDKSELPSPPDNGLPASPSKILIYAGEEKLPSKVDPSWDLCIATGKNQLPVKLEQKYQGWIVIEDVDTLFVTLDIRIRSDHTAKIEQEIFGTNKEMAGVRTSLIICTYRRSDRLIKALESAC
ncbi:unnamed protein product, partial [marine sediment metagenome]